MRSTLVRLALVAAAGLISTTATMVADELPPCSPFDVYLTVSPEQPGCTDILTLGANVTLTDSCWSLFPPVFSPDIPDLNWDIDRFDTHQPSLECLSMVLTVPFSRNAGPLEAGPYSVSVDFSSTSSREGDYACSSWVPFEVTCCPDLPQLIGGLALATTIDRSEVVLTWTASTGAEDYVILGDSVPDGKFTTRVATGTNGSTGASIPIGSVSEYFLVAGRNACGVGPRR